MAVGPSDIVVDENIDRGLAILGNVGVRQDEGALHERRNLERDEVQCRHADVVIVASLYDERVHAGRKGGENALGDVEGCIAGNGLGVRFTDGEDAEC